MQVFYSDKYSLPLGEHVFPAAKYRLTKQRLLEQAICAEADFVEPDRALDEEIALVHTPEYIDKLKHGRFSDAELTRMEVPYSAALVEAFWVAAGGTIAACRQALRGSCAVTLCGGFHHAFPDHGEGFCLINDVAVAIRTLQRSDVMRRALTVDCDVHHGNGTAEVFRQDPSVFTLSIHQRDNYPYIKPPSDIDIHLEDRTRDETYLLRLGQGLASALGAFRPDLIVYLAGADPYEQDQLGGLALTMEGLRRRDRLVFETARNAGIPVAVTLAGGYARKVDDTIAIHVNTVRTAKEIFVG
jgi:acetoin utilization deacetylase AcuC-like enzyme